MRCSNSSVCTNPSATADQSSSSSSHQTVHHRRLMLRHNTHVIPTTLFRLFECVRFGEFFLFFLYLFSVVIFGCTHTVREHQLFVEYPNSNRRRRRVCVCVCVMSSGKYYAHVKWIRKYVVSNCLHTTRNCASGVWKNDCSTRAIASVFRFFFLLLENFRNSHSLHISLSLPLSRFTYDFPRRRHHIRICSHSSMHIRSGLVFKKHQTSHTAPSQLVYSRSRRQPQIGNT